MLTGVSRQRRAANERERRRIQGVNRAFIELKNALPLANTVDISKIDILRVATKWIDHLSKLLDQDQKIHSEPEPQLYELLGEEFSINDHELEEDYFLQGQGRLARVCLFFYNLINSVHGAKSVSSQFTETNERRKMPACPVVYKILKNNW